MKNEPIQVKDALAGFHPGVAQWFLERFKGPTEPQSRGWPAIRSGEHVLIAAPTGSGKTLAAFLASIDRLFQESIAGHLPEETRVLYVSPLKALSNDIHRNLSEPLEEIGALMERLGHDRPQIRAAVRTGDTSAAERRTIIRKPPHILVTTPESFYLMLTSESGRSVLKTVRTLILDEIHALADNRRGAHLALSVERLEALTGRGLQRIGLSATQHPMSLVANLLVGMENRDPDGGPRCTVIDEGHLRELDICLEAPDSPLEAVMANESWDEVYRRLVGLIREHRTTLIFVNTRRLAERITYHLAKTLGEQEVASHHGSLSLPIRRRAEDRLKQGGLKALVATASLELGIDIGSVDLVCQIGSPRTISNFLQRVGRSGHYYGGVPKGRLFPLTRDELIECIALIRSVKSGQLDRLKIQDQPLDVLSQQIVAATACEDWGQDDLFALFRRAYLYRNLEKDTFMSLVHMLSDGIATKRGRRGAFLFYDGVNGKIKARKGARLAALLNAGAIPDNADYRVMLEPTGVLIGTLNEDFAIESLAGDIFRLGNNSWRILKIENGKVRVEDAHGMPPTIPFWLGEAPARSDELSLAVSNLRAALDHHAAHPPELDRFLHEELCLDVSCAEQVKAYLFAIKKALGSLPTQENLIMERFFDEAGGMQLVIHAPFGGKLNRAWGLALRKRFCRSFNFELQAAATEDAIVLSLGPKHSFPLDDVFRFLNPKTVREILIQALLDAPMFQTRWRWTAARSLALVRNRGGKRIPPNIQRMEAEDLIATVFPDQLACLENIAGDREVPDHPLVGQTIEDCLNEAMDVNALIALLTRIDRGSVRCKALDLPEPSPLAHEVLNAAPYAFLDDAPLEERRTRAVYLRRSLDPETIRDQGLLDDRAIQTVVEQTWPEPRTADEVHEALIQLGGFPEHEGGAPTAVWREALPVLIDERRVGWMTAMGSRDERLLIAAERLPQWRAVFPDARIEPDLVAPDRERGQSWDPETARLELIRGFLEVSGPVTLDRVVRWFGFSGPETEAALLGLEAEGFILRGAFDSQQEGRQWCHRGLLARIHHMTLQRLRSRIKPVTIQDYMRFLFQWQRVAPDYRARSIEGLESVLDLLEGFEAASASFESELLPRRVLDFSPYWLDQLCLSGKTGWARIRPPSGAAGRSFLSGPLKTTPIGLFPRANTDIWCSVSADQAATPSGYGRQVLEFLTERGATFFAEILTGTGLLYTQLEMALGELTALGLVSCDSFAGLRSLLLPAAKKVSPVRRGFGRRARQQGIEYAGRWFCLPRASDREEDADDGERIEYRASVLLRRYGVVFRKLLDRENGAPTWRELLRVFRHLEAVGEIRGGRFVDGFSGEQFALPEALPVLRAQRQREPDETPIILSGADPLNLTGLVLPGQTVGHQASNRILFRDGLPVVALVGQKILRWAPNDPTTDHEWRQILYGKKKKDLDPALLAPGVKDPF